MESPGDTNPLRMLRSGLPIVRPRVRGNKHATLAHPTSSSSSSENASSEPVFHIEMHHSGARTLPKVRASPPLHAILPLPQSRILERHHSSLEIENNQNQSNVDENPIPLPWRDRSKTLQPKASLPRHQRKHPLIIPGGGVTRTLAKMAVNAASAAEDQVDGHFAVRSANSPIAGTSSQDNYSLEGPINGPEEFEQRIDFELAALDSLPIEETRFRRCSAISEDLLEFSDNLIDCDDESADLQQVQNAPSEATSNNDEQPTSNHSLIDGLRKKVGVESAKSAKGSKTQENVETDLNRNPTSTNSARSKDWGKVDPLIGRTQFSPAAKLSGMNQHALLNYNTSQTNHAYAEEISTSKFETDQCEKPLICISSNDDFSSPLPNVYLLSNDESSSDLSRQSDHVSCEDLLEFACDGPNTWRTRGPRNGKKSDEVRIMLKVLQDQSTPESCVAALNVTKDWDVLVAIKLVKLQGLLKNENNFVSFEDCKMMLNQCGGDIVKAAALLRSTDDTTAV